MKTRSTWNLSDKQSVKKALTEFDWKSFSKNVHLDLNQLHLAK